MSRFLVSTCFRWRGAALLLPSILVLYGFGASRMEAALPASELVLISPSGVARGSSVEVELEGKHLQETRTLRFSHPGITAERQRLPADPFAGPVLTGPDKFVVRVESDVPPGVYEVRAVGRFGTSNPRPFAVGTRVEVHELEPNDAPEKATLVPPEATVNGRIGKAADLDYFRFAAQKGDRVLVACAVGSIDSSLNAVLALYDVSGKVLERSRRRARRDPLLDFQVPMDGEYLVRVSDLSFGGSSTHLYRLEIGAFPHVDAIFPPVGLPGATERLTLYGRNLPGGTTHPELSVDGKEIETLEVEVWMPWTGTLPNRSLNPRLDLTQAASDFVSYRLDSPRGLSNSMPLALAQAPMVLEQEPNDSPPEAQPIRPPCEVAGRFAGPEDRDGFRFHAREGDVYWLEVFSQRLGLATDPYLVVERIRPAPPGRSSVGAIPALEEVAVADDPESSPRGGRTSDPALRFVVPETAEYRVSVHDLFAQGHRDPRRVYRLAVGRVRPDFRLTVSPGVDNFAGQEVSGVFLRRGGRAALDVAAHRLQGFTGEIVLRVDGLPKGVTSAAGLVAAGTDHATIILEAEPDAFAWDGSIEVVGRAGSQEAPVERTARSVVVLVPNRGKDSAPLGRVATSLALSVSADETALRTVTVGDGEPLEWVRGSSIRVPLRLKREVDSKGVVECQPRHLPDGVKLTSSTLQNDKEQELEGRVRFQDGETEKFFKLEATRDDVPDRFSFHFRSTGNSAYDPIPQFAERTQAWVDRLTVVVKALEEADREREALVASVANLERAVRVESLLRDASEGEDGAINAEPGQAVASGVQAILGSTAEGALVAKEAVERVSDEIHVKLEKARATLEKARKQAAARPVGGELPKTAVACPSNSLVVLVRSAPHRLTLGVERGTLRQGGSLEIPVQVSRVAGIEGPVSVGGILPEKLSGVQVEGAKLESVERSGRLLLRAAATTPPGRYTIQVEARLGSGEAERKVSVSFSLRVVSESLVTP